MKPTAEKSPITGKDSRYLFTATVLGRHQAHYYLDESIDYIFVASPTWLEEAYSSAIAITDTGILARNTRNVNRMSELLASSRDPSVRGIDLGAGYGLFVRGMRDAGFDFYWQDIYAPNLVARGFEADENAYEIGVAFEVLEHLENPAGFIAQAVNKHQLHTLFFSAECFEPTSIPDANWWYWSFETGQHISFFSRRALEEIGEQIGMRTIDFGGGIYAFSTENWSHLAKNATLTRRLFTRLHQPKPPQSKTETDHFLMRDKLRQRMGEGEEEGG